MKGKENRLHKVDDRQDSHIVTRPDQLRRVLEEATTKTVVLQLPSLAPNEGSYWENRLNAEQRACGCGEGAAFLLITLIALAILLFSGSPLLPKSMMGTAVLCTVLAVTSIVIGKAFGRFRAKRRLARAIHELSVTLSGQHSHTLQPEQLVADKSS